MRYGYYAKLVTLKHVSGGVWLNLSYPSNYGKQVVSPCCMYPRIVNLSSNNKVKKAAFRAKRGETKSRLFSLVTVLALQHLAGVASWRVAANGEKKDML